jgi:hypothetical protein
MKFIAVYKLDIAELQVGSISLMWVMTMSNSHHIFVACAWKVVWPRFGIAISIHLLQAAVVHVGIDWWAFVQAFEIIRGTGHYIRL